MTRRDEQLNGLWTTFNQSWTVENRMQAITNTTTGQVTQYFYDGDGNRVKKVQNGVTTIYIGAIYEKNLNTSEVTTYYFAGSQVVATSALLQKLRTSCAAGGCAHCECARRRS